MIQKLPLPLSAALAAALCIAGCKKAEPGISTAAPPDPAITEQQIKTAFKDAKPELKSAADQAAAALQNNDPGKAFLQLNALNANPDLTPEERAAAAQSMSRVSQQLRAAAQRGDQEAAKLLDAYRSGK